MKYSFVAAALAAPIVLAAPTKRQSGDIDVTVLQFALTLEHLENVFYKQALQKFSVADFAASGYGTNYYNNLKYIAFDEQSHVEFLESALTAAGQTPVAACTYNFPYTDVNSFVTLSSVLEGVGTSAYLGGAPLITSKAYLTAAGSILVTEALHTSLQRSAVNEVPFGTPYGTPLDPTSVYTLAASFIQSCPASNPALPFKPYPALTLETMAGTCEEPNCYPNLFEKRGYMNTYTNTWGGSMPSSSSTYYPPSKSTETQTETYTTKTYATETYTTKEYDTKTYTTKEYDTKTYTSKEYATETYTSKEYATETYTSKEYATETYTTETYATKTYATEMYATETYTTKYYPPPTPAPSPSSATKNMPALSSGATVKFMGASDIPAGSFLTFVFGLSVVSVAGDIYGSEIQGAIPAMDGGQTYVFVTSAAASGNMLDASSILFGPAILEVAPGAPAIDYSQS